MSAEIYYKDTKSFTGSETVRFNVQGFLSMGIDVSGTFTTGGFKVEGSVNGSTWSTMPTFDSNGDPISGGAITAVGHYSFNCAGYAMAKYTSTGTPSYTIVTNILAVQAGGGIGAGGGTFTTSFRIVEVRTTAAAFTAGQVGYINSSGTMTVAGKSSLAISGGRLAIALTDIGNGASGLFLTFGIYTWAVSPAWTVGGAIYLTTSGAMTQTAPSVGEFERVIGFATSASAVDFRPDTLVFEVAA